MAKTKNKKSVKKTTTKVETKEVATPEERVTITPEPVKTVKDVTSENDVKEVVNEKLDDANKASEQFANPVVVKTEVVDVLETPLIDQAVKEVMDKHYVGNEALGDKKISNTIRSLL